MSQENVEAATREGIRPIRPMPRRTWEDRLAVRFSAVYRGLSAGTWRVFERLRPGHALRHALGERLVARSYGAFNRNDVATLLALYHPDCVWDWSHFEGWPDDQVVRGAEGLRRAWSVFSEVWGDFRLEASDLTDLGDRQMLTCHMSATGLSSGVDIERTWWQVGYSRGGLIALVANYSDHRQALEAAGLSE